MRWTDEQQRVINVRNKNVLVSAAAGSGKTAVLVERIMQLIMDRDNPVDIDKLLVVTFTNAAAREMRERILKTIEKAVDSVPEENVRLREHLEKQCTYIHNAKITTIDSFCLDVIRENIGAADIDPGFRIADNSEITLMNVDAMKKILDRHYENMDHKFMNFVSAYSKKVGDDKIETMINKLYNYAQSYPNPVEWLKKCGNDYKIKNKDELKNSVWIENIEKNIKLVAEECYTRLREILDQCTELNGLFGYREALTKDIEFLETISSEDIDIENKISLIKDFKAASLKAVRKCNDEETKNMVKTVREQFKSKIGELKKHYCSFTLMEMLKNINECAESVEMLIQLTLEYNREFSDMKREKNIVDFSDIEHIALNILTEEKEGEYIQSDIARDMSKEFVEIMIDEYQDSNYVQEVLLTSVSTCSMNKNNIFMVGDVKQSIYKFRLARPEIFLEKYQTYPVSDNEDKIKIVLSKNFRSRKEVLASANLIFSQIMTENLGGIRYDDESRLYYGADYEEIQQNQKTKLILIDKSRKEALGESGDKELGGKEGPEEERENIELEAVVAANQINELVNGIKPFMVRDKESGEMRAARYSDIAILFRSKKGTIDTYMDVLSGKGIPVTSTERESSFNSFEINTILNMLSIVDNPRQDIPFVSVLKNMFSYNENELAQIRADKKQMCFFEAFTSYEGVLEERNKKVLHMLEKYRHYATYMPICKLIKVIVEETGFEDFVGSMKNGEKRLANIDLFTDRAESFGKGVYTGLFNFIRYIEKIKQYNAVESEDMTLSDTDNSVKLMSIHKSKGLEFPIVILGAAGKKYSNKDITSNVVLHSSLGIGLDRIDPDKGIKYKTIIKETIAEKIKEENLAEELRILYVAMTRAKEKLIIIGTDEVSNKVRKLLEYGNRKNVSFGKEILMSSQSYLDLIIMSLVRHKSFANIRKLALEPEPCGSSVYDMEGDIETTLINIENIVYGEVKETVKKERDKKSLIDWDSSIVYSHHIREELNRRFSFVYPYENDTKIKAKHSVSDIKHSKMEIDEFAENKMHLAEDDEEYIPLFMREEENKQSGVNVGAIRGSAIHRFFELFDYSKEITSEKDIVSMLDKISRAGTMTREEISYIQPEIFLNFIYSDLGKRMKNAYNNKLLFRERQFVMGMRAGDTKDEYHSDELVVVQGIIDAFFYENDEVVIVDYKTDNVNNIEELKGRYKAQLQCYAGAIKKVTGREVKEMLIYSTKFNRCINV